MQYLLVAIRIALLMLIGSIVPVVHSQPTAALLRQTTVNPIATIPQPGAIFVSPGTSIALRFDQELDSRSLSPELFQVSGSKTGVHTGQTVLADDRRVGIFRPDRPFAPGETVSVRVGPGLRAATGEALAAVTLSFTISATPPSRSAIQTLEISGPAKAASAEPSTDAPVSAASAKYLTLPADYPPITTTVALDGAAPGKLFIAPFVGGSRPEAPYLLILDPVGEPLYHKRLPPGTLVADFKAQPTGLLTYYNSSTGVFHAMDSSYTEVRTYRAGNGYPTDVHELQVLPNGHALLMIYDRQTVDMSKIVEGGLPDATVIGLVIQELDPAGNVVFEWRSWDHFEITDTVVPLANQQSIDYVHGNAIEVDHDGHLLISSRHLNEVTKINRAAGEVIWRLGGKRNQFAFINDQPFSHQHDIRRQVNGHITLFDNRNNLSPAYSRAVEYAIDEEAKTVTKIWEYRNSPDIYSPAMGSAQRLSNGNTLSGWGSSQNAMLTEATPDGTKVFELVAAAPRVSYRAFRLPWQGFPTTEPTLVAQQNGESTELAYSWNGATNVESYRVYGGVTMNPTTLIETQTKSGFETRSTLSADQSSPFCFFRVVPLDAQGRELRASFVAKSPAPQCEQRVQYMPLMQQAE